MSGFRAIALIAARNEADVISQVLAHLIQNGLQVFLIDDGSTDDTIAEASSWLGQGLLEIERRPSSGIFDWTDILRRKEELAFELEAEWFLHHDADEFRESPWSNRQLVDAIRSVDELGYNAIDFRVLNFPPTHDRFARGMNVREEFQHFEPAPSWDAFQVKAWKRGASRVDLVSSGGHEASFSDRRVCPIQFLNLHYPIRSQAHGRRKVFVDRLPRFSPEEMDRQWHIQYNELKPDANFIRDPSTLRFYNADQVKAELLTAGRDAFLRAVDAERAESERHGLSEQLAAAELLRVGMSERLKTVEAELEQAKALNAQTQEALRSSELGLEHARQEIAGLRQAVAISRDLLETERLEGARRAEEAARNLMALRAEALAKQHAAELQIEELRAHLVSLAGDLRRVYESRSWRVTRPLRRMYELLNSSATPNPVDRARPDGK